VGTTKKSTDHNHVAKGLSAAARSLLVSSVLCVSCSSMAVVSTNVIRRGFGGGYAVSSGHFLLDLRVGQYPTQFPVVNLLVA